MFWISRFFFSSINTLRKRALIIFPVPFDIALSGELSLQSDEPTSAGHRQRYESFYKEQHQGGHHDGHNQGGGWHSLRSWWPTFAPGEAMLHLCGNWGSTYVVFPRVLAWRPLNLTKIVTLRLPESLSRLRISSLLRSRDDTKHDAGRKQTVYKAVF